MDVRIPSGYISAGFPYLGMKAHEYSTQAQVEKLSEDAAL